MKRTLVIFGCGGMILAGGASAQTLLWTAPGIENVVCVTGAPDIDGDGGPDVVFETYDAGAPAVDNLFAIRGASSGSGEVIWSARPLGGPSNSGGYGDACLRFGPDLGGDGFPDVMIGMAWGNRSAFSLDGRTGETQWKFDTYVDSPPVPPVSGWVYAMASLEQDLDGDGVPEVVFGTGSDNNGVYCVSGADGSVFWRYQAADAIFDVMTIEDLDNDGIRDVIAGVGDLGQRVVALSGDGGPGGSSGFVIWLRDTGSVMSLARLPDLNGDSYPEVVAGTWRSGAQLRCLSGRNGADLWTGIVGSNAVRVVTLDDVTGDGFPDIAVGSWLNQVRVHDGRDGSLAWFKAVGTVNGGDVWAIDRLEDVTGDGINDVCAGSFDLNVYVMDGVTGQIEWQAPVGNRVFSVRGVGDLNGNGWPDVVAGTQKLTTGGICYAFEGRDLDPASVPEDASRFRLSSAVPNPFRDRTEVQLTLAEPAVVSAWVLDTAGRRVAPLQSRALFASGQHRLGWDGTDGEGRKLPAGVYYVRVLRDGEGGDDRRVVLVR